MPPHTCSLEGRGHRLMNLLLLFDGFPKGPSFLSTSLIDLPGSLVISSNIFLMTVLFVISFILMTSSSSTRSTLSSHSLPFRFCLKQSTILQILEVSVISFNFVMSLQLVMISRMILVMIVSSLMLSIISTSSNVISSSHSLLL